MQKEEKEMSEKRVPLYYLYFSGRVNLDRALSESPTQMSYYRDNDESRGMIRVRGTRVDI